MSEPTLEQLDAYHAHQRAVSAENTGSRSRVVPSPFTHTDVAFLRAASRTFTLQGDMTASNHATELADKIERLL